MKITKQRIIEIIKEEVENSKNAASLATKTMSNTQRRKDTLDRLKSTDKEFDSLEMSFVNQFEEFLTNLAKTPGISLGNHKSILQKVMKMLQSSIKSSDKKIEESLESQQLAKGPLSSGLIAKLSSIDDEFIDYYRRFLIIYNKLRDMRSDYNFDNQTDHMLIDFANNLFAKLNLPLQEYDEPTDPLNWPQIVVGYEDLFSKVQDFFPLEEIYDQEIAFSEDEAKKLIMAFKKEYQNFLSDLYKMTKSGKVRGQTQKLNEVKKLIIEELKVLNGKKMVRN